LGSFPKKFGKELIPKTFPEKEGTFFQGRALKLRKKRGGKPYQGRTFLIERKGPS